MLILGVDPGTLIMGYSLLDTEPHPRMVRMEVLYMKNMGSFDDRIRHIFESMTRLIDETHPDHLSIEAPFMGKNVQSMLKLGRAQGVTIAAAMSRGVGFREYEPATIKRYITGNGNASKEMVHAMLQAHLGIDLHPTYLDATDALAAAYCHYLASSTPLAEVRGGLAPKRTAKRSVKAAWTEYVKRNHGL